MRFLAGLCLLAWAMPALATDRVERGPVPVWVRPVTPSDAPAQSERSVTYLLADEQFRLAPERSESYAETVLRIDRPEGLSAGNFSLSWQPESQTLTVHKLTIRRGKQLIDVLASGQTFEVLRREANLESAMLDGMLTATIQPEDVQVGDIVTLATTVTSSDPTYRGHVEQMANAVYSDPIGRHHFSAEWPATLPIRQRQTDDLPLLKARRDGEFARIELTTDSLQPPVITSGSPARYRRPRLIELSDFRDWSELAALFAPLYDKAATIPANSPLQAEVARIRSVSSDPKLRAEAALALVQGRIRYVALLMGTGNFVPADAMSTWNRRFGDCKAKSALLVAILRALDITADPVIVNLSGNDGLDQRLPMIGLFNHVIVRALIGGKVYWLDGTRTGDLRLDQLATPDVDWGLPLARGATLVRMVPEQLQQPSLETVLRIDSSKGIGPAAPMHAEVVLRGDRAYATSVSAADLVGEARERYLRDYWKQRYAFADVRAVSMSYDAGKRELRFIMDGLATMAWSGRTYWLVDSSLGDGDADFERGPGERKDAPFGVTFPYFMRSTETVLLPPGVVPDRDDISEIAAGVEYRRTTNLSGNAFTVETSTRSLMAEFPGDQAISAQKTLRALADRHLALRVLDNDQSVVEADRSTTGSATTSEREVQEEAALDGFTRRGFDLLADDDWDGAIAAFQAAVRRNPNSGTALAGRGFAFAWHGDLDAATRDLDAAAVIEPDDSYVLRARGYLAQKRDRNAEALRFYTRVLDKVPDDHTTYGWRAEVYRKVGDTAAALRDAETATKLKPSWADMYFLRARIYQQTGQPAKAFAEARRAVTTNPQNSYAHYQAAIIYNEGGRREDALIAVNRAIEIAPRADLFLARMLMRADRDFVSKRQDVEAALRFDPSSERALEEKAYLQDRIGDPAGAVATYSTLLSKKADSSQWLTLRAETLSQVGRKEESARDFAAARAAARDDDDFNLLCWNHALTDIELPAALRDCQFALEKMPNDYMSFASLGLVQIKLGQIDEAIASYDRALSLEANSAIALYGRATAWARKGNSTKAAADRAAALKADPDIVEMARKSGLI